MSSPEQLLTEFCSEIDEELLLRSFTHTSYVNENPEEGPSNERLEFLGDAVLNMLVSRVLFEQYPDADEGYLSLVRSSLVRTESLAEAGQNLQMGQHLRLGRGEDASGGRNKQSLLADVYEAVVAAVYLSCGLRGAQRFVNSTLVSDFQLPDSPDLPLDAKSYLEQWAQEKGAKLKYYVADRQGPDHRPLYTVEVYAEGDAIGKGSGASKQAAEESAAGQALKCLGLR